MKGEDSQQLGSLHLRKLLTKLEWLSQSHTGLNNIMLACVTGHACLSASDSVKYEAWVPAAAAMLYSMLDPATASVRLAAVEEFRGRGEAERNRSADLQTIQVGHVSPHMRSLCTSDWFAMTAASA